ncbi:glutamate O-methyltransferase [Candidatus Magnetoovum chiemensis]|nr:glutamate O-methyltransferase [Candidatus Magnetoovum chiemensis]
MTCELDQFNALIRKKCGIHYHNNRIYILSNVINARKQELKLPSLKDYYDYINRNTEELNVLIELLTVNETYFYREISHFRVLDEYLIPALMNEKQRRHKIKILSIGCATGEEPYSILIYLLEKHKNRTLDLFSIAGCDIDRNAVLKAKKGIFTKNSFRRFPNKLKEKYFHKIDDMYYSIDDFFRKNVILKTVNILNDIDKHFDAIDVIFYRNVSIYFDDEMKEKALDNISKILSPKGYLILSSVETLAHNKGILSLIEKDGYFFYTKNADISSPNRHIPNYRLTEHQRHLKPPHLPKNKETTTDIKPKISAPTNNTSDDLDLLFEESVKLAKNKHYEEALELLDDILNIKPSHIRALALKAEILFNTCRYDEAESICSEALELDKWTIECFLINGLIAKQRNDKALAIKMFKSAIYIKPSCWLSHYYLGELYRLEDKLEIACREYDIAVKILQKDNESKRGLSLFELSFNKEQLLHLCTKNIDKIKNLMKY